MNKKSRNYLLGFATTLGLAWCILPAQAQISVDDDPQSVDNLPTGEVNSLTGGNSFNPLELIHRANLSNGRDAATFSQDTENNLNDAAAEFRRQQLELFLNRNANPSAASEDGEVVTDEEI